jgi:hypothetical protein
MSDPLFGSIDITKSKQRLTNLEGGHTVLEQLDLVIDEARGEFYTRLGLSRLTTILALAEVDPPTTDNDYLYLLAATTEQKMIRRGLLKAVTFLTKEGEGGRIYQEWNDVGAFRDLSAARIDRELARLDDEIDNAFGFLSGTMTAGANPRIKAAALGSTLESQYRKVGFSLYAVPVHLYHFALDTDTIIDE